MLCAHTVDNPQIVNRTKVVTNKYQLYQNGNPSVQFLSQKF